MELLNKIKQVASSIPVEDALGKIKESAQSVGEAASRVSTTVANAATATSDSLKESAKSSYDAVCEIAVSKIKKMLRGMNLSEAIDALNHHQEESGTDVSALVNFISQLKEFSEDGKE